jgi:hypothetical protein
MVSIGSVFDEISESLELASEGHHEPRVFHGNAEPFQGLTNRGIFESVNVDDHLGKLLRKLPPQDLLAYTLDVEEEETRR